jgi:hypothetical protein
MKQSNLIVIVAIVIFVGALLLFLNPASNKKFIWEENYKHDNKQPYGAEILYKLLEDYQPNSPVTLNKDSLSKESLYNAWFDHKTYFFIGEHQYLNETESQHLLEFAKRGNTVMVISSNPDFHLLQTIDSAAVHAEQAIFFPNSSLDVLVKFTDSIPKQANKFNFHFQNVDKKELYSFKYFNPEYIAQNSSIVPLSAFKNGQVNFITAQVGKGRIFYHSNPIFFSNYHLIKKQGAQHAARVLSYLKPGEIIWDVKSQEWSSEFEPPERGAKGQSPLSFILGNEALRTALWILLLAGLIYMLFALKRIQRIVPIIEPKRNSSLAFIRTIGRLYFLEREHTTMVRHQMRYFLSWIREKYRIQASELDDATIEKLHVRSGVSKEIIQNIREEFNNIRVYAVLDDAAVIKFHQAITRFYKHCK